MTTPTLDYYNTNSNSFYIGTVSADMSQVRDRFLTRLSTGAYIMDLGCGSGRDTKAFIDAGYRVDAVDGSEELCRLASRLTGQTVKHMLFRDLDENNKYDGIWACASLLHMRKSELPDMLARCYAALKMGGYIYLSFKYGTFEGERNGRYFTDLDQDSFAKITAASGAAFETADEWISGDARAGRENEKWLNVILRKTCS